MSGRVYHHLDSGDRNDTILEHVCEGFWAHKSYRGNGRVLFLRPSCTSNMSYPY